MTGNPLRHVGACARLCALMVMLVTLTGCGMIVGNPGTTINVAALPGEDISSTCRFDLYLNATKTAAGAKIKQAAVLVIYERGDSQDLFADPQIQEMATNLHMVVVFARECDSPTTGEFQPDATKGPGRMLFAALAQFATEAGYPEVATAKVVLSGFSAAGVLSTTMANAYPDRILGFIPFAAGSDVLDLDTVPVTARAAQIPALVLANAYDPKSGVQRSLRYFQRGYAQGAPWGFGVQNNTGHCCTLSTRDLMIPWVTALMQPLLTPGTPFTTGTARLATASPVNWAAQAAQGPTVRFYCYTDGYQDSYYEDNCWIPSASILPVTTGGPESAWLPDAASADAWLKWVTSPGTN